jgi:hypothetical protein
MMRSIMSSIFAAALLKIHAHNMRMIDACVAAGIYVMRMIFFEEAMTRLIKSRCVAAGGIYVMKNYANHNDEPHQ